jgi:hypothetical protein
MSERGCYADCGRPIRSDGPPLTWLEDMSGCLIYCLPCGLEFLLGQYRNGRELDPDELAAPLAGGGGEGLMYEVCGHCVTDAMGALYACDHGGRFGDFTNLDADTCQHYAERAKAALESTALQCGPPPSLLAGVERKPNDEED